LAPTKANKIDLVEAFLPTLGINTIIPTEYSTFFRQRQEFKIKFGKPFFWTQDKAYKTIWHGYPLKFVGFNTKSPREVFYYQFMLSIQ
jgi:hypothetical protein